MYRLLGIHRGTKDVTLGEFAAEVLQGLDCGCVLDNFCYGLEPQSRGHLRHRTHQGPVTTVQIQATVHRAVDLDVIEWEQMQVAQRRITGAEVDQHQLGIQQRRGRETALLRGDNALAQRQQTAILVKTKMSSSKMIVRTSG